MLNFRGNYVGDYARILETFQKSTFKNFKEDHIIALYKTVRRLWRESRNVSKDNTSISTFFMDIKVIHVRQFPKMLLLPNLRTHRGFESNRIPKSIKKLRLVNKMKADQPEKYNANVNTR